VTPGSNQYYIFEIAIDSSLFEDYDHMTEDNFYGSWNDSNAPARFTDSSYTLSQAAWDRLKAKDSLTFRVGTTSASDSWDNYQVSTAGTMSVTGSQTDGGGTSTGPSVSGPEEWARDDPSPAFDVTLDENRRYYIFEITSDESIFDNYDSATEDTFYATWQDSDAPARLTDSRYELPDAAWQRLKSHETLCFRIGVTSTEDSWDDYAVSSTMRMRTVESRRPPSRKRGTKSAPPGKPADSDPFDTPGWTPDHPRDKKAYAKSAA
jgi:hypothetical protein